MVPKEVRLQFEVDRMIGVGGGGVRKYPSSPFKPSVTPPSTLIFVNPTWDLNALMNHTALICQKDTWPSMVQRTAKANTKLKTPAKSLHFFS